MNVSEVITQLFGDENMADKAHTFKQTIGNGTAQQFLITHNLNSANVMSSVFETAGDRDLVWADIEIVDNNSLRVKFGSPIGVGEYTVVVIG
jgi:hypothetical protein